MQLKQRALGRDADTDVDVGEVGDAVAAGDAAGDVGVGAGVAVVRGPPTGKVMQSQMRMGPLRKRWTKDRDAVEDVAVAVVVVVGEVADGGGVAAVGRVAAVSVPPPPQARGQRVMPQPTVPVQISWKPLLWTMMPMRILWTRRSCRLPKAPFGTFEGTCTF